MTYQSGSAISYYILDISDAERKAAQLRSIYQGIRQDAASLSTPVVTTNNGVSQAKVLQEQATLTQVYASELKNLSPELLQAQSATIQLIASTYELGIAAGLTNDQIEAQFALMSRDALAIGDLAAANLLADAAVGATIPVLEQQEVVLDNVGKRAKDVGDKFQTGLINKLTALVGPVAAVTTVIGLFKGLLDETSEGFKLNADIDQSHRSLNLLLEDYRNVPNVFDDAANFANKYKLTQKEVNEALDDAVPVLRNTTQGVETVLGVFDRLAASKPGKTFNDAARAISELQSGNVTSIARIFDIPLDKANAMKKEIEAGGDAVVVVNNYLEKTGIHLSLLDEQTKGVAGKTKELAFETENYQRALGGDAGGIGLLLLQAKIDATKHSTEALSGSTDALANNYQAILGSISPTTQAIVTAGNGLDTLTAKFNILTGGAVPTFRGEIEKSIDELKRLFGIVEKPIANSAIDRTKDDFVKLTQQEGLAIFATAREADALDRLAGGALNASVYVEKLTTAIYAQNAADLANQRVGERSGGEFNNLNELTTFKDREHQAALEKAQDNAKAAADAKALKEAEISYAQSVGDTATARRLLNQELKDAKGNATEEFQIKTRLNALDKASNKGSSKGLSGLDRSEITLAGSLQAQLDEVNHRLESGKLTQLQRNQLLIDQAKLQEKINDAIQKEKDLQIGIALDSVHNQQQNIEDARELNGLRRAENDSRFSAEQKNAVRLREQEILLEQQKRANDLAKEQTQLNQTVKESGVGAAQAVTTATQASVPISQLPPIGSGVPVASVGTPQAIGANGEKITINLTVNVDKDGVPTAIQTDPSVALHLIGKALGVQVTSGGFP